MLRGVRSRRLSAFFSVIRAVSREGPAGGRGRARRWIRSGLWGLLQEGLSAEEKSRLGVALYDAGDQYRDAPRYAWEERWLDRWLPAKPTKQGDPAIVLVGAAGAGREVTGVLDRGYEVIAIEPSRELARLCRARMGERGAVIEARYEAIEEGAIGRVDAVILGLGSLSHVLDAGARARLFEVLGRVCPRGPILASALAAPKGMSIEEARREGRAAKIGRRIGARVRAARGLPAVDEGEIVFDALGFAKLFTREELAAIGEGARRRTIFEDEAPDGMWLCAFVQG